MMRLKMFKDTVWSRMSFSKSIDRTSVGKHKYVKERDYLKAGSFPVVDQGKKYCSGYTNDAWRVIDNMHPYIIFGDHTRIFKYIDSPVALGADGTKIIKPLSSFDSQFYFYFLLSLKIPNKGYSRHYSFLKEQYILYPSLEEQRTIARILSTVQDAIAAQEEALAKLTEFKQSMMQHLFIRGTKGEKTKMTEIGEIPESWEVVELGSALNKAQYGLSKKGTEKGNCGILRMTNQADGYIDLKNLQYIDLEEMERERFKLNYEDIIFNRTNSLELVGKTSIFTHQNKNVVFASYLIRLQTDFRILNPYYLNFYLNLDAAQLRLKSLATRGVSQSNISASRLKFFKLPLPRIEEQLKIAEIIRHLDLKINIVNERFIRYEEIFKSLLSDLMSIKQF